MRSAHQISRIAGAAGIVLIPLILLLIGLALRLDTGSGARALRPGALDLTMDVDTALRLAIGGALTVVALTAAATLARRR